MKDKLEKLIKEYVKNYSQKKNTKTNWGEPLIAYANAKDGLFFELKKVVHPNHAMPQDFLEEAETIISYFIPFEKTMVTSNINGVEASKEWAIAYTETNRLISDLNIYIHEKLKELGIKSTVIPNNYNYNEETLLSQWSQRHIAYIAGLGKFGINNMLITDKGCAGRFGSIVTNFKIEPTKRDNKEYCLYKANKSCEKCVSNCINGALKVNSFDRHKCYEMCLFNVENHSSIGFCDVCGKCTVNVPCTFTNPVQ